MEKQCNLCDSDHGMDEGTRSAGLSFSETTNPMENLHTTYEIESICSKTYFRYKRTSTPQSNILFYLISLWPSN